jgi:hypothetical protein
VVLVGLLRERLELGTGSLPLPEHAQQLKEERPQLRVRGFPANPGLKGNEGRLRVALPETGLAL